MFIDYRKFTPKYNVSAAGPADYIDCSVGANANLQVLNVQKLCTYLKCR